MRRSAVFLLILSFIAGFLGLAAAAQDAPSMTSIVEGWSQSPHADASAEAFTHWNDEGEIPERCALCHAGAGLRSFYGFDGSVVGEVAAQPTGGVIDCDTCHIAGAREISQISFPSGVTLPVPEGNGTCFTCHQGRQSGSGLAAATAGMDPDTVNPELSFLNPHYAAAAATLMGAEAAGPFQYDGKDYKGRYAHVPQAAVCSDCHDPHSLQVEAEPCIECHKTDEFIAIRVSPADHDGDGDVSEGIAGEIATLHDRLADAVTAYANEVAGVPILYSASQYPYYFVDTDGDGVEDPGEAAYPNRYASWTPRLLRAAYNYQFVAKDPGAFAHNPGYILQILIDSVEDITGAEAAAVRP